MAFPRLAEISGRKAAVAGMDRMVSHPRCRRCDGSLLGGIVRKRRGQSPERLRTTRRYGNTPGEQKGYIEAAIAGNGLLHDTPSLRTDEPPQRSMVRPFSTGAQEQPVRAPQ